MNTTNQNLLFVERSPPRTEVTAKRILAEMMNSRRLSETHKACENSECVDCLAMHLPKIISAVESYSPVTFVLPAFPGKSPNPEKVLGALPDHAEWISLKFLGELCQKIKQYYPPGIKIIICSDGRVFSDVVGMNETDVTAYQEELGQFIKDLALFDVTTFNLDDYYSKIDFIQMREKLMSKYGKSLDSLKEKVRSGANPTAAIEEIEANRMYCGITRFMFEDSMHSEQTKSRAKVQKESRAKAYEVIRRSNAWSELIADYFPEAVRLSIHPQACGASKLGIRFIGNETWMTPWHGVAVETKNGPVFLKRSEAEALGAELIQYANGRPSHFFLRG